MSEQTPSPLAIAGGAFFSLWIGVLIAGTGLVFTPAIVVDPAAKQPPKPVAGSSSGKKDPAKDKDAAAKTFVEGNFNAPFYTYTRGKEASGSPWKTMRDNVAKGTGPSSWKETDLNSWMLNFKFTMPTEIGFMDLVAERPNFRIADGKLAVSAFVNFAGSRLPFVATGDFSGSGHSFKVTSGRFGSCPLPSFLAKMFLSSQGRAFIEAETNRDLIEAWPKLRTAAIQVEGDAEVLVLVP